MCVTNTPFIYFLQTCRFQMLSTRLLVILVFIQLFNIFQPAWNQQCNTTCTSGYSIFGHFIDGIFLGKTVNATSVIYRTKHYCQSLTHVCPQSTYFMFVTAALTPEFYVINSTNSSILCNSEFQGYCQPLYKTYAREDDKLYICEKICQVYCLGWS